MAKPAASPAGCPVASEPGAPVAAGSWAARDCLSCGGAGVPHPNAMPHRTLRTVGFMAIFWNASLPQTIYRAPASLGVEHRPLVYFVTGRDEAAYLHQVTEHESSRAKVPQTLVSPSANTRRAAFLSTVTVPRPSGLRRDRRSLEWLLVDIRKRAFCMVKNVLITFASRGLVKLPSQAE